jgi:hypothetical protein
MCRTFIVSLVASALALASVAQADGQAAWCAKALQRGTIS